MRFNLGSASPPQVRHPIRYQTGDLPEPTAPPALGQHDPQLKSWLDGPPSPLARPSG